MNDRDDEERQLRGRGPPECQCHPGRAAARGAGARDQEPRARPLTRDAAGHAGGRHRRHPRHGRARDGHRLQRALPRDVAPARRGGSFGAACADPGGDRRASSATRGGSPSGSRRSTPRRAPETFDVLELADGRVFERQSRVQIVDSRNVGPGVELPRRHGPAPGRRDAARGHARPGAPEPDGALQLASQLDLQGIVQAVTDAATELSGARFGAFFYNVTDHGDAYMLYALSGARREDFERFGQPRATAALRPDLPRRGPIRCADVLADPRYGQMLLRTAGMPAGICPVRSYLGGAGRISRSGEVIGGLFFGHPDPGVFTERAERLVAAVAAQAAIAMDNARLYEAAQQRGRGAPASCSRASGRRGARPSGRAR